MFSSMSKGLFKKHASNFTSEAGRISDTPIITDTHAKISLKSPTLSTGVYSPQLQEKIQQGFIHEKFNQVEKFEHMINVAEKISEDNRTREFSPKLLSVGGGKGGIGKSFFSANAAIELAKKGFEVALVDLDFGSANLHTCLGVTCPKLGIFDFMSNQVEDLDAIATKTEVKGLKLYSGGQEFWQQIRPQANQKIKLISKLQKIKADYVILDLGAGTHVNTLDFFIFSHAGIIVVVPEPTSIENAYVFLKSVMFRKLQSIVKALNQEQLTYSLIEGLSNPKNTASPATQILNFTKENPEIGEKIIQILATSQLGVVMNQVRTRADTEIGNSITQISKKYFGFNAEFIGASCYDDTVWKTLRNRRPLCIDVPASPAAQGIRQIVEKISTQFLKINTYKNENGLDEFQQPGVSNAS
jgi:flagellar biosynthesis protein FlhG